MTLSTCCSVCYLCINVHQTDRKTLAKIHKSMKIVNILLQDQDFYSSSGSMSRLIPKHCVTAVMCLFRLNVMSVVSAAFYEESWDVRYIRQCGVFGEVGPAEGRWCFERRSTYGVRLKICHCDNMDGCNVASTIVQNYSKLTFFLLISFSWLFFCSRVAHSV